jgi:hypothetical protein
MTANPDYFVVMVDYGKTSREAVVDPNHSQSDAMALVREALHDGHDVLFVHHIHDRTVEDVTEDMTREAYDSLIEHEPDRPRRATQEQMWDHARDYRKNEAA